MKAQKGITLVALVITIIVLLILAMVSISIVNQQGIFNRANKQQQHTIKQQKANKQILQKLKK